MKKLFDKGLTLFKNNHLVNFFLKAETWSEKIGLLCLYIGMPVLGVIVCISQDRAIDRMYINPVLVAVGFAIVSILFGYIADKMLEYVRPSINQAKTNIVNGAFFDVLAVFMLLITVACVIGAGVMLFNGEFTGTVAAIVGGALTLYFAVMLLSPEKMLNVRVQESATPAQSLIAISAFLIKAAYRLIPFAFGAMMVVCMINAVDLAAASYVSEYSVENFLETFATSAMLPLIGYFLFLLYYFVLDLCMSVFRIADAVESKNKSK